MGHTWKLWRKWSMEKAKGEAQQRCSRSAACLALSMLPATAQAVSHTHWHLIIHWSCEEAMIDHSHAVRVNAMYPHVNNSTQNPAKRAILDMTADGVKQSPSFCD